MSRKTFMVGKQARTLSEIICVDDASPDLIQSDARLMIERDKVSQNENSFLWLFPNPLITTLPNSFGALNEI